jgi:hypothetical protein
MPDTRESGDGRSPPPFPALARQLFGWLSSVVLRLRSAVLPVAISIAVVECVTPPPENTPTTETFPPPLTDQEMERFCSQYEEVKDLSYLEMTSALVHYAPDDSHLKADLTVASEHPLRGFPTLGQFVIDAYLSRCPQVADVP